MKTNLETLRISKQQSGAIRIALTYTDQEPSQYTGKKDESYWIISSEEIAYVIRRLTGQEPTRYIIDDGLYHLAFGTDGILCHDFSNEKLHRHYVTFPGQLLANALAAAQSMEYQDDYKRSAENVVTVTADQIRAASFEHRNRAKIIYHDNPPDYSVKQMVIRLLRDPQTKDYFKNRMRSFIRQVGEQQGELHLMLDSYSQKENPYPSFYFWLETHNHQRIYNGGIINHKPTEATPDYSIHT